uniref:Uncharacterized protein n=1 Tax=Rhizophora mucronata TaxID=61149 RepID=A0A2P2PGS6_RHIMU
MPSFQAISAHIHGACSMLVHCHAQSDFEQEGNTIN